MNAHLARTLYGKLDAPNVFFSPVSLTIALAMTQVGARGATATQMSDVLQLRERDMMPLAALARDLSTLPQLRIANRLYGRRGYSFDEAFLRFLREQFGAPLHTLDFTSTDAAAAINDWVSHVTNDKIRGLVPPGTLGELTRLVLVNAIYFKGAWVSPFTAFMTKTEPFFGKSGAKPMPLMRQRLHTSHGEAAGAQVLELTYQGKRLVMDVILPRAKDGLASIEQAITRTGFESFYRSLSVRDVDVVLPKLTMTTAFEASALLAELGMPLAFGDAADFTGMTRDEPLNIDKVFHKAFVDVNEEGTEAAAATAAIMVGRGGPMTAPPPIEFRADHPFAFVIRDSRSDTILFVGRFSDP